MIKQIEINPNIYWDLNDCLTIRGENINIVQYNKKVRTIDEMNYHDELIYNLLESIDKKLFEKLTSDYFKNIPLEIDFHFLKALQIIINCQKLDKFFMLLHSYKFPSKSVDLLKERLLDYIAKSPNKKAFKIAIADIKYRLIFNQYPNYSFFKNNYLYKMFEKKQNFDEFFKEKKDIEKSIKQISGDILEFAEFRKNCLNHENEISTINFILNTHKNEIVNWSNKKISFMVRKVFLKILNKKNIDSSLYSSSVKIIKFIKEQKIKDGITHNYKPSKKEVIFSKYKNNQQLNQKELIFLFKNNKYSAKTLSQLNKESIIFILKEMITKKTYLNCFSTYGKSKKIKKIIPYAIKTFVKQVGLDPVLLELFSKKTNYNEISIISSISNALNFEQINYLCLNKQSVDSDGKYFLFDSILSKNRINIPRYTKGIIFNYLKRKKSPSFFNEKHTKIYLEIFYSKNKNEKMTLENVSELSDSEIIPLFKNTKIEQYIALLESMELNKDNKKYSFISSKFKTLVLDRFNELNNNEKGSILINSLYNQNIHNYYQSKEMINNLFKIKDRDVIIAFFIRNKHKIGLNHFNFFAKEEQINIINELIIKKEKKDALDLILMSQYVGLKSYMHLLEDFIRKESINVVVEPNLLKKEEDIQCLFDHIISQGLSGWYYLKSNLISHLFNKKHFKNNKETRILYKINPNLCKLPLGNFNLSTLKDLAKNNNKKEILEYSHKFLFQTFNNGLLLHGYFELKRDCPSASDDKTERLLFLEGIKKNPYPIPDLLILNTLRAFNKLSNNNKEYFSKILKFNDPFFKFLNSKGVNPLMLKNIQEFYCLYKDDNCFKNIIHNLIFNDFTTILRYNLHPFFKDPSCELYYKSKLLKKYFADNLIIKGFINIRDLSLLYNVIQNNSIFNKDMIQNKIINIFNKYNNLIDPNQSLILDTTSITFGLKHHNYQQLIKLIYKESLRINGGSDNISRAINFLRDGMSMAHAMESQGDLSGVNYKYKSIYDLHEFCLKRLKSFDEINIKFNKQYPSIKNEKFQFQFARSKKELSHWGSLLHNCLGLLSYWKNVFFDNHIICAIKCKKTNKIIYALEIAEKSIEQISGKNNFSLPKEDLTLIKNVLKVNNFIE